MRQIQPTSIYTYTYPLRGSILKRIIAPIARSSALRTDQTYNSKIAALYLRSWTREGESVTKGEVLEENM